MKALVFGILTALALPNHATESQLSLQTQAQLTLKQQLGQRIFFDKNLSEPAGQACASCHDPKVAFSDVAQDSPVSKGAISERTGTINSPALSYASFNPFFHFDTDEGLYIGGHFLDGRANDLAAQAKQPFLNPDEMNNPDGLAVATKVSQADYADMVKKVYGSNAFDDLEKTYDFIADALASFENSEIFQPFSSKYDYYLAGLVDLSPLEKQGLELFDAEDKGNCAACHPSTSTNGQAPLFTDFSYDNLGVPKHPGILKKKGDDFVEKGLGKTVKKGAELGKFRVPSLRNIAKTAPYMHNGRFDTLEEVLDFYNTRDTDPERWGAPELADNVNTDELGDLKLTADENRAIIAFMRTLTDGHSLGESVSLDAEELNLPYVRLEGQGLRPQYFRVAMQKTQGDRGVLYQISMATPILAHTLLPADIPYYNIDTGILELAMVDDIDNGTQRVMQLQHDASLGNLVFVERYNKAF